MVAERDSVQADEVAPTGFQLQMSDPEEVALWQRYRQELARERFGRKLEIVNAIRRKP